MRMRMRKAGKILLLVVLSVGLSLGMAVGKGNGQGPGQNNGQGPGQNNGQGPGQNNGQGPGQNNGHGPGQNNGHGPGQNNGQGHDQGRSGQTPAVETVCGDLQGAAFGLCNAYCEALDCDGDAPHASANACERVAANFASWTGGADLPCEEGGEEPILCGGIAGLACPDGLVCVDDESDGCDPEAGGADCPGICVPPPPAPECPCFAAEDLYDSCFAFDWNIIMDPDLGDSGFVWLLDFSTDDEVELRVGNGVCSRSSYLFPETDRLEAVSPEEGLACLGLIQDQISLCQ